MFVSVQEGKPADRLDAWRHHISEIFAPTQVNADYTGFRGGSMRINSMGSLMVTRVSADAAVLLRTPRAVAAGPEPDFYKVGLQLQGNCVLEQDGREAALEPGDFSIFDARRPFRLAYEGRYRALFVMLPPKLLPFDAGRMEQIGTVRVPGRQGLGALTSAFLTQLAREVDYLDGQGAERLSDNILDLLTTVYAQYFDEGPNVPADTRRKALRVQIQHYIEQRLDDPGLTPTSIAAALHISTRYLHKVFEHEGITVTGWIRMRRLEKIRRDLANPLLADRQVSAVGVRWGLVNPSQLSRLFRDAYGASPREYRARAAADQRAARQCGEPSVPRCRSCTGSRA